MGTGHPLVLAGTLSPRRIRVGNHEKLQPRNLAGVRRRLRVGGRGPLPGAGRKGLQAASGCGSNARNWRLIDQPQRISCSLKPGRQAGPGTEVTGGRCLPPTGSGTFLAGRRSNHQILVDTAGCLDLVGGNGRLDGWLWNRKSAGTVLLAELLTGRLGSTLWTFQQRAINSCCSSGRRWRP